MRNSFILVALIFSYGDIVIHPVPSFYSKVCEGIGKVTKFQTLYSGQPAYFVENIENKCPIESGWFEETELLFYFTPKRK